MVLVKDQDTLSALFVSSSLYQVRKRIYVHVLTSIEFVLLIDRSYYLWEIEKFYASMLECMQEYTSAKIMMCLESCDPAALYEKIKEFADRHRKS
ncbi:hypothetical protein NQ317_010763 [Molorchus minor]|uniref:Uncharacterized protein n=1 Tax=Molorchus minor TaxID=1323400 RepID=A0ABQ9IR30_9CUCU|nr:hypothetical protein NQ317_010763 [Molorchus minor]